MTVNSQLGVEASFQGNWRMNVLYAKGGTFEKLVYELKKEKKNSQDIRLKRTAVSRLFIGSGIPVWVT